MNWVFLVGTVAFTLSGYLVGARKQLDLLGVVILAVLTAVGGGIIRDLMLNRTPLVFYSSDAWYLRPLFVIAVTLAVATAVHLHRWRHRTLAALLTIADSLGLVAFSLAGAAAALDHGFNLFGTTLLAFVTAIGGGIVRDVLINEVPSILREDFYGTVAVLVGAILFGLHWYRIDYTTHAPLILAAGVALRLFAHRADFRLPKL